MTAARRAQTRSLRTASKQQRVSSEHANKRQQTQNIFTPTCLKTNTLMHCFFGDQMNHLVALLHTPSATTRPPARSDHPHLHARVVERGMHTAPGRFCGRIFGNTTRQCTPRTPNKARRPSSASTRRAASSPCVNATAAHTFSNLFALEGVKFVLQTLSIS